MSQPSLDIVIINFNTADLCVDCVRSAEQTLPDYQLHWHVVDNASSDSSLAILQKQLPQAHVIALPENRGYAAACNTAREYCTSEYIIFCNSDVVFHPQSLSALLATMNAKPRIGLAGSQQVYANGKWQRSYGLMPGLRSALSDVLGLTFLTRVLRTLVFSPTSTIAKSFDVPYLDGAVLCFRSDCFDTIGGFDPSFFFFGEDIDVAGRAREAGWRVVLCPNSVVTHLRGAARQTTLQRDKEVLTLNEKARIRIHRQYASAFMVKLATALEAMHYAQLWLIRSAITKVVSEPRRSTQQQKADLCKYLCMVCAEELENIE